MKVGIRRLGDPDFILSSILNFSSINSELPVFPIELRSIPPDESRSEEMLW
jgi:hypothetical protein